MIRFPGVDCILELALFEKWVFGNSSWTIWVAIAGLVLVVLTLASYRRSSVPKPWMAVGVLLRCLGLAMLLICLLEPLGTLERPKPQANIFAILVDSSRSIDVVNQARSEEEASKIKQLLSEDSEWQRKLSDEFRVRRYVFDSAIEPVDTFDGTAYEGKESSITGVLESLRERYRGRPLAGVLMVTDGRTTDRSDKTNRKLSELGFPVYPLSVGSLVNDHDIRILSLTTRQSDFETAPVTIQANVTHRGFANQKASVDLIDSAKRTIQTQILSLKQDNEPTNVEFRFRPEGSGVQGYQVSVRSELASAQKTLVVNPEAPGLLNSTSGPSAEITLGNNRAFQVVDRGRGPYQILYVAGRPNWEHKFLKRALEEDDELEVRSLIRIAKKEAKFNFRDTQVDSSNPLFSGFEDVTAEEKEQYDEPVFARLGRTSADQFQKGFPKDADELFEYSAIVLDDLEHDFFSLEEQSLLRQFVAVRGGGLLVLAGQESMRGKGFRNSVLSQILPVYGDDLISKPDSISAAGDSFEAGNSSTFQYQMTREGWLQPFLRLAENESAEHERLNQMPPFEVLNRTNGIKPGASVLAEATSSDDERVPVLVTQRFGKGRSAALMIGDMWRWALHHEGPGVSPLGQSWRQMIRWLIADVPKPIQMKLKSEDVVSSKIVQILVDVKGSDFKSIDNAQVTVSISAPNGTVSTARGEGANSVPGQYECTSVAEDEGVYTATCEVKANDGSIIGSSQLGWVYDPSSLELQQVGSDLKMLESIASETGGSVVSWDELTTFAAALPSKKVPVSEFRVYPLWHQSWVLMIAVLCLCCEWGLRRRNGLA